MADERENAIEWINGQNRVTVTLSQGRYISKIKKLASKFPDEVEIVKENKDGTIVAHIPLGYIKINNSKRELTDAERAELSERARNNFNTDKNTQNIE